MHKNINEKWNITEVLTIKLNASKFDWPDFHLYSGLLQKIRTFAFSPNKPCPKYSFFYDLTEVIFKKIQTSEKHFLCFPS